MPDVTQVEVNVGVTAQGVLLISVPAKMRESMDERHIILIGIAIAKEQLGVKVESLKAVMIEVR